MRNVWLSAFLVAGIVALVPLAGAEEERKNELSAIVAGTHEDESTYFTLGVEYKRELSELFAMSAIGEVVVEGDSRDGVGVLLAVLNPWSGLHLLAGPGFERSPEGTSFLFRVGAGWGFEFGERYSLTPAVEFDFVDGDDGVDQVVVFGASFGFGF